MCLNVVAFLFVTLIHTVAFAAEMKSKVWHKGFRSIYVVLWIVDWLLKIFLNIHYHNIFVSQQSFYIIQV